MDKCPKCQTTEQMVRHGKYWRKPRDREQVYRVPIWRWFCKACKQTTSALPDFLLPGRWYVVGVVSEVVVARAEEGASWGKLEEGTQNGPEGRTMRRWWQALGEQGWRWVKAILKMLAEQDSGSPWLEPCGEGASVQDLAQYLLGAAGYLLAWAKSRWEGLAGYGWKDRWRFLGLWGSGQGMGRLV